MTGQVGTAGMRIHRGVVLPEWIDINGHMNVAYYVLAFDLGVDALWHQAGISDDYIRQRRMSTFAVEAHITYRAELSKDDPYEISTYILALDEKRLHQIQTMKHAEEGHIAATAEWLNLSVDLRTRRVCPFPQDVRDNFLEIARAQPEIEIPAEVGKRMRVNAPIYAASGYNPE